MLEQAREIIEAHKEKCFKCGGAVAKNEEGYYKCPSCGFEWANLFIKRLPKDAFLMFKEYADAGFCSDYGMALKSLVGSSEMKALFGMLSDLDQRLAKLETGESKPKEMRMMDGTIKRIGGNRNGTG